MPRNNLRIIYHNLVDASTTTVSASTTAGGTSTANLKKDAKSLIWRSTGTTATLTATFTEAIVGGVILPFCNLSSTSTITVVGYRAAVEVLRYTSIPAAPYSALGLWDWGALPLGVNAYSYGGGTYGRVWFTNGQVSCTSLVITITDASNTAGYIEASRLVIGSYWSPTYNTSFGLSTTMKDLSEHRRTEAGDLDTNRGTRHNTMTFDLKYLDPSDRLMMTNIMKGTGIPRPLFISLFPEDNDSNKEQSHQIYGKLSQLGGVSNPIFDMYSSTIDIEEI